MMMIMLLLIDYANKITMMMMTAACSKGGGFALCSTSASPFLASCPGLPFIIIVFDIIIIIIKIIINIFIIFIIKIDVIRDLGPASLGSDSSTWRGFRFG